MIKTRPLEVEELEVHEFVYESPETYRRRYDYSEAERRIREADMERWFRIDLTGASEKGIHTLCERFWGTDRKIKNGFEVSFRNRKVEFPTGEVRRYLFGWKTPYDVETELEDE